MRPTRSQLRLASALLVAAVLSVGGLPFGQPRVATADDGWDYAAERDALLGVLPADPTAAAMALVDDIYGDDFAVATIATMELLRRSAIPVLNLEDKVIALPDDLVLAHAAVAGELVPALARSIRAADYYTLDELNDLLVDSGLFAESLPIDALAGALGSWGKPSTDRAAPAPPPEVIGAGSAVRALGAKRGQVYHPGAIVNGDGSTVTFDVLQVVLVFGHLASPSYRVVQGSSVSPLERLLGVGVARAAGLAGNCQLGLDFYDQMEQKPWWLEGLDQQSYEFLMSALKEASGVPTSIPKPTDLAPEIKVKNIKIGADKISAIITTILWIAGIRLELKAEPGETHFGPSGGNHQAQNAGKDVAVTARAHFEFPSSGPGLSANAVACLKLLTDVEAFENKGLPDFKVRWSIEQPKSSSGDGKLLVPLRAHTNAFRGGGGGGATTNASGESRVVLQPAHERQPGQGKATTERATIIASLDKDDFPFKLKDLIGLRNPAQFAFDKIFDLANSAIRRLGLPKQRISVAVEYHGSEIIVIEGETTLFALYYFLPVKVKMWTCDGVHGTWQGSWGFKGDRTFLGDAANRLFKVNLPANATVDQPVNEFIDLRSGFARAAIGSNLGLEISIDDSTVSSSGAISQAYGRGRVVGDAVLTIGGQPAGLLAIFDGRSATFDVRRFRSGEREDLCPGGGAGSYFPIR